MIDFHYATTANNFKIGIMLEETGQKYRLIKYDMLAGDHLTSEFRKINPNSKVPAIVDHEPLGGGEPFAVFESGAILLYLAAKTGSLIPTDPRQRSVVEQWLIWQVAGVGPMHGQAHHFHRFAPEDQTYGKDRYTKEARRLMQVLENRLQDHEWVAGDYSIADITCYPQMLRTNLIGIQLDDYPSIKRWADAVGARPAVRRAADTIMSEERGYYQNQRANLSPDQWSNLFGDKFHGAARAST